MAPAVCWLTSLVRRSVRRSVRSAYAQPQARGPGSHGRRRPDGDPPCGRSPYGIFHLAGNLQEWIARDGQLDRANPLHILRGGAADAVPPDVDVATTIFRNPRPPRTANYSNGFRCVIEDPDELP